MTYPEQPWEYLPVLNECIKILLTVAIGSLMGYLNILQAKTFVPQATQFIFYVALPLLVIKGLGIGIDFYDDKFLWNFIFAFLILRVFSLLISLLLVFLCSKRTDYKGIGQVAVMWLALTWISTVILGVPIAGAVFQDTQKGQTYGILAGISSFIFQLPLQLFIFECHLLEKEYISTQQGIQLDDEEAPKCHENNMTASQDNKELHNDEELEEEEEDEGAEEIPIEQAPQPKSNPSEVAEQNEAVVTAGSTTTVPLSLWWEWAHSGHIWKKILLKVLRNPVLWGIAMGFALSLSTVGPRFLFPNSPDYVPGLGWIFLTAGWFGDCVSPVSLFAMGLWMQAQGRKMFRTPFSSACFYMLSKLVLVPLLMVGLAKAFNLNNEAGRAAVLIAALPISMASFSLASRYKIGEAVLSENVVLGTALVLPTILIWNIVMDAVNLFPIS